MNTKEYQNILKEKFELLFPELEVKSEWISFKKMDRHYAPKVDLAFSPFSITAGETKELEYDALTNVDSIRNFLEKVYHFHEQNLRNELFSNEYELPDFERVVNKNSNARCFIALEIENRNSKKHMMGSIINAASLGRVGIGVAYCDSAFRTMARILHYLAFLRRVEKNTYDTTNFLLIKQEQLEQCF